MSAERPEPPRPALSVVMPAYQERRGIGEAMREVQERVFTVEPRAELVVVDDGSTDGTGDVVRQLAARDERVRLLERRRGGHGPALVSGLDAARGERLLLLDSDGQVPLDGFAGWWRAATEHEALLGVRTSRDDPPLRKAISAALRLAVQLLFGATLRDPNAPCKIVEAAAWECARRGIPDDAPVPSVLLAVFLRHSGYDVVECEVPQRPRVHGVSWLRGLRLARFCAEAGRSLLAYRRTLRRPEAAPAAGSPP